MKKYVFLLNFSLPSRTASPEQYLDALFEAGCDDASVGINRRGMIGLDFARQAGNAEEALRSAIRDVRRAIPGAELVMAGPDLVNLTQMAEIFEFSRQNMRKYAIGPTSGRDDFPLPAVPGDPSLWHLAEIARWLKLNTSVSPKPEVVEIARAAAQVNLEVSQQSVSRILETSE